jgi:cytochrome c
MAQLRRVARFTLRLDVGSSAEDWTCKENFMKARWIAIPLATVAFLAAGAASADEALARRSGCLECHGVDQKIIGPSFYAIAERYRNDARARAPLVESIKKGSKGKWIEVTGGTPMPGHSPRLSDADVQRLVDWVMSL